MAHTVQSSGEFRGIAEQQVQEATARATAHETAQTATSLHNTEENAEASLSERQRKFCECQLQVGTSTRSLASSFCFEMQHSKFTEVTNSIIVLSFNCEMHFSNIDTRRMATRRFFYTRKPSCARLSRGRTAREASTRVFMKRQGR